MLGEIDSKRVKINGIWFMVYIDPDTDEKPSNDKGMDDLDHQAWLHGDWRYVGVTVTMAKHPTIRASLWGVEYSASTTRSMGMDQFISDYPVPAIISEMRTEVASLLAGWEE